MSMSSKDAYKHQIIDLPDPQKGRGWRWLVAAYLSAIRLEVDFSREIYVFGVAGGNSIESIRKAFYFNFGLQTPRVWGFDSFSGIPDEAVGVSRPLGWTRGAYDSSVARRSLTYEDILLLRHSQAEGVPASSEGKSVAAT